MFLLIVVFAGETFFGVLKRFVRDRYIYDPKDMEKKITFLTKGYTTFLEAFQM